MNNTVDKWNRLKLCNCISIFINQIKLIVIIFFSTFTNKMHNFTLKIPSEARTQILKTLHNWNNPNDFWKKKKLKQILEPNKSLKIEDEILVSMTWELSQKIYRTFVISSNFDTLLNRFVKWDSLNNINDKWNSLIYSIVFLIFISQIQLVMATLFNIFTHTIRKLNLHIKGLIKLEL